MVVAIVSSLCFLPDSPAIVIFEASLFPTGGKALEPLFGANRLINNSLLNDAFILASLRRKYNARTKSFFPSGAYKVAAAAKYIKLLSDNSLLNQYSPLKKLLPESSIASSLHTKSEANS